MSKILVVTDTTSTMTLEEAKQYGITLLPLYIIIKDKEYQDGLDIQNEQLYQYLKEGMTPTTTQPSVGYLEAILKEWKKENYDHIIIITVSSKLSGTYQTMNMAIKEVGMNNVHCIDSKGIGVPLMQAAIKATTMAKENQPIEAILEKIQYILQHSTTFVYPSTLEQLKKGGRISPMIANMANLMKIKPLLKLKENDGEVEKAGIARTEAKLYQMIANYYQKHGVNKEQYELYILHAQAKEMADALTSVLAKTFIGIQFKNREIPTILVTHTGLGCVVVQSVVK